MHAVLERQLRKVGASAEAPPAGESWCALLERISQAYVHADEERYTLERSITISAYEMRDLNERLATQRDRLLVTVTSMADGLCVLDAEGRIETANPAAERLLESQPGALRGVDFADLVTGGWPAEKERRFPLAQLREAIRTKGSCRCDDARFMTLTRAWLPVSFALTPFEHAEHVGGSVLIFSDIRRRKAAADALRESESRFRAIFQSAAVGIVRLDLEAVITDCNRTFSDMLGEEAGGLLGTTIFARMHPADAALAAAQFEKTKTEVPMAVTGSTPVRDTASQVERRYLHRDGSVVYTMQALSFVRDPSGTATFPIAVIENVTARKNLETSLREAQKLEAVGQLAAGIAHEINTPVQFVSDSVHFVRDSVADLLDLLDRYRSLREAASPHLPTLAEQLADAEEDADLTYLASQLPKALDRALDGLQRVASIVGGMKAFAHPDKNEKAPSDLNRAVETTLTISRNEYKYVADVDTELGPLPPVVCNVGELNQVLLNIIVNAAHAIGDVVRQTGKRGRIAVRTWRDGGSAFISIADTGGGIPEAIRHRIFDPFFTTKEVGRGTGQGLAIARSLIVERHQGELTFETEIGRGTTFTIRLPLAAPTDGARAA